MKMVKCLIAVVVISLFNPLSQVVADTDYPNRAIEVVIPYAPGGNSNLSLRSYKDKVAKILGQPIVEVHKPGAAGAIGMNFVRTAKPDGYTIVVTSYTTMSLLYLSKKATYNYKDFEPICSLTTSPIIFAVNKNSPFMTMHDLISAAKKGKIKYSTTGVLGGPHIIMEALSQEAGFRAIHIPYAGGAEAMTAVLGGHVDVSICSATGLADQLRILANTGRKRTKLLPGVPTLVELGYPKIAYDSLFSLWAPKGTPKEITKKIYEAHVKALEDNRDEITKVNSMIRNEPIVLSPEEVMDDTLKTDEMFRKVISRISETK